MSKSLFFPDNSRVKIESDSQEYELVFNETIVLLDKKDIIKFRLNETPDWTFKILFVDDENDPAGTKWFINRNDDKVIEIFCNKFYSPIWVENSVPMNFSTEDEKNHFSLKLRSTALPENKNRLVNISVWKKM